MTTPEIVKPYMFQNFPGGELVSNGKEYQMNSPLSKDDTDKKFWINIKTGYWQCFKTHTSGNFAKFISLTTGRKYREIECELLFKTFLNPPEYYSEEEELPPKFIPQEILDTFEELNQLGDSLHRKAVQYLLSRKMFSKHNIVHNKFFICTQGLYKDRLIIPYFIDNVLGKNMFYFQGRALSSDYHPKYLNYKGIKSSKVLYPYEDDIAEPLYITEGALDARILQMCGLNATSTLSCSVSRIQLEYLKQYDGDLVIAYDGDSAGLSGLKRFDTLRKRKCIKTPKYIFPPVDVKDWNDFYMKSPEEDLVEYIETNTKDVDFLIYL
jgi:DNA primase